MHVVCNRPMVCMHNYRPAIYHLVETSTTEYYGQHLFFYLCVPRFGFVSVLEANATGLSSCNNAAPVTYCELSHSSVTYYELSHSNVTFAPEFQCCYFCESSCLFYLSFNFDFYVSKIMHL